MEEPLLPAVRQAAQEEGSSTTTKPTSPLLGEPPAQSPPRFGSSLTGLMGDSVLVSGRIGRLQSEERLCAFTDAVLAIICTSCAVPLWANGTQAFNPVRLVPYVTTFFILYRLWEKHCQDFSRVRCLDEHIPQINVMWLASMSVLPFSFVVLFVPTSKSGHLVYLGLWVGVLGLVSITSGLLSSAARRLSGLRPGDPAHEGWTKRDWTLRVALLEVGLVVIGASLVAWEEHLDVLTDNYKHAFRPHHVRAAAVCWVVALLVFWVLLAARINFQLVSKWMGRESPVLFDGLVNHARVEIFSDGVYAASSTGLMLELLNGLLRTESHDGNGGEGEKTGTVWPGLVSYIYCFHIVAVLHRSHSNIVAKIPQFRQHLLAINCLVCLSVAFIPALSNILDTSWHHDPAALTTAAAFLLCASLLLLFLLQAALKQAPLEEAPECGIQDSSADALLSEMLGRPLARGAGIISTLMPASSMDVSSAVDEEDDDLEAMPQPAHFPRLFQDPSCLPQGAPRDTQLLKSLQAIRDQYEIGSACILPAIALFLTLLTASFQLRGGNESPYLPVAFLLTFFVYSIERKLLRPRAAKQIARIQRRLRQEQQQQQQQANARSKGCAPPVLQTVLEEREDSNMSSASDLEAAEVKDAEEQSSPHLDHEGKRRVHFQPPSV